MKWNGLFGAVALGVGLFFLYAAWGSASIFEATSCAVSNSPGVHFTERWTLEYHNTCGGHYDHYLLYLLGFTVVGITLIGGGAKTMRELLR
jgi:hypothetical protein